MCLSFWVLKFKEFERNRDGTNIIYFNLNEEKIFNAVFDICTYNRRYSYVINILFISRGVKYTHCTQRYTHSSQLITKIFLQNIWTIETESSTRLFLP